MMIDATIIKAHQHGAEAKKIKKNQAIGCSKARLTTPIHTVCEANGRSNNTLPNRRSLI